MTNKVVLKMPKIEKAVILAAGNGSKLKPYSDTTPKPAIPIGNKPIIRNTVESLKSMGISKIYIVTSYLEEQIRSILADLEGITFIRQKKLNGTANALKIAIEEIEKTEPIDRIMVVYGDVLSANENFEEVIGHVRSERADAFALVKKLESERVGDYLCAKVDDDKITRVLGHPRHGVTHKFMGIYVFNENIKYYLEKNPGLMVHVPVGVMSPLESQLEESIALMVDDGLDVSAVEPVDFIVDIDKPWHLLEANSLYLDYLGRNLKSSKIAPDAKVSEKAEIEGKIIVESGSVIGPYTIIRGNAWIGKNTKISNCIIGNNVMIGNNCNIGEYSKIWDLTSIGNSVRVLHSAEVYGLIMDGVSIMHYSHIWGIVGRYTDIGAAVVCGTLRFDDSITFKKIKGRREFPSPYVNSAFLGDFCRTGVNAIIMPGVFVGPYSIIGPGVIQYDDVPPRTIVLAKQETIKKEWGPEKYGW